MFTFLQGHRTYLLAAAGAVVVFLQLTGHLSTADAQTIFTVLGIGAVASLRAAIGSTKGR